MAIPRPVDQFDLGRELNPNWPPPAPGYPRPSPQPNQQPDPGWDDDYDPQFIPPYVPPGPGQQSPFQPIPPAQINPPAGPYIASVGGGNPQFQQYLQQMQQMWPPTQQQMMRDYIMNSYGPAQPGVSPGMPGMSANPGRPPFYGPPQSGQYQGAAPTLPDMSGYPAGMSPGMPGSGAPPYSPLPQTGGAEWTWPQRFDPPAPSPMLPSLGDIGNMMMPGIPGGM
jgi:hypothetical protein